MARARNEPLGPDRILKSMIINSPLQVLSLPSLIFMSLPLTCAFAAADDPAPSRHEESIMDFDFRMPTFGGKRPENDGLVWSWDDERVIVGTCAADLEMRRRDDH